MPAGSNSEGGEWRVGLAKADITPEGSIRMGGYGARVKPSEGVLDRLYAKALALEAPGGERAVLVTTDLISFDAAFASLICEDIHKATGLERRQVLINSSHTHAGPIFGITYPVYYGLDPDAPGPTRTFNDMLRRKMLEAVSAAVADLAPAQTSWAMGAAMFAMNRRRYTPKGVINAPYPRGYVDRSVPVLRIVAPDGRLRGVVFNYACHNTTLGGDNLRISGDYAGCAQRYVEQQHPGAQAMFLMGCGADANPYPRGNYDWVQRHGEALGGEVCRLLREEATNFQPVRGPLRIAFDHMDMPLEPQPSAQELAALRTMGSYYVQMADKIQALIDSGKPWATHYRTPIAVWQFGGDLTLVRLSGEVVGDYIRLIEKAIGPLNLWIAGYCADYFGYMPSARVHAEGGYEARDFITGYGFLDGAVEEVVLRNVRRLAEQAGRVLPPR